MNKIEIFTDGSRVEYKTHACAGCAYVVYKNKKKVNEYKAKVGGVQDIYRSEIEALCQGLLYIKNNCTKDDDITIYMDNITIVNRINGDCYSDKCQDIWQDIELLCLDLMEYNINIEHIKSHVKEDDFYANANNVADILAKRGARSPLIPMAKRIFTC